MFLEHKAQIKRDADRNVSTSKSNCTVGKLNKGILKPSSCAGIAKTNRNVGKKKKTNRNVGMDCDVISQRRKTTGVCWAETVRGQTVCHIKN